MKICMVTPRFPYPTTKGDKLRAFHALRELSARHEITLVSATDEPLAPGDIAHVAPYCRRIEVVPLSRLRSLTNVAAFGAFTREPLQTLFYRSAAMRRRLREVLAAERFDVVYASLIRVLPYVWDLEAPPVVVDLVDSLARGTRIRLATAKPWLRPLYALEADRLAAYERAACERFAHLVVCAEPDRLFIGAPNVSVVRTCADLTQFSYRREGRGDARLVMTGNQGYAPNIDAVAWFASEVWPLVRARIPAAEFRVVGVRPPPATRALDGRSGITVTGPVDDVAAELHRATLAVCPMRGGSGLQTKVLEAFATGTPVVATTFGNEGIGARPGSEITLADDAPAFAAEVVRLLGDAGVRDAQAAAAHELSQREFTWAASARKLEAIFADAVATPARASAR